MPMLQLKAYSPGLSGMKVMRVELVAERILWMRDRGATKMRAQPSA